MIGRAAVRVGRVGLVGLALGLGCLPPLPADETGEGSGTGSNPCGPTEAVVDFVVDGDTVQLEDGQRVRYILVDTPETSPPVECYGEEAKSYNTQLVEGESIHLEYDAECRDRYDRLLAYVYVGGVEVNRRLVERGYGCVLHIPPNGNARVDLFRELESVAQAESRGMWGSCPSPCN